jgi:Leucine-rich repeat (LRR) protein
MLNLDNTRITDEGLKHLAGMTQLEELNLSNTQVTDAGVASLAKFRALKTLKLNQCLSVSSEAIEQLRQALPQLEVQGP